VDCWLEVSCCTACEGCAAFIVRSSQLKQKHRRLLKQTAKNVDVDCTSWQQTRSDDLASLYAVSIVVVDIMMMLMLMMMFMFMFMFLFVFVVVGVVVVVVTGV